MKYVQIEHTDYELKCEHKKYYNYFIRHKKYDEWNIGSTNKSPLQITKRSDIGKEIYRYLENKSYNAKNDKERDAQRDKEFRNLLSQLQEILDNEIEVKEEESKEQYEKSREHYMNLYSKYVVTRDEHGYSDLQFLSQICQGVGVGLADTVLKIYISALQTVLGVKATNVIAIGSQSSGKTFALERGLSMIPDEYIIKGVHSEAYFFGKFNGMDLTHYIFYLGDLGGVKDDEDTIRTRDILKRLNTDGSAERGIRPDGVPCEEIITGHPAIFYSTVEDDIINEQERSRSNIVKPPIISEDKLTVYNAVKDSPGMDYYLLNRIENDVESVKGLTWYLMENVSHYEVFNPYMFNVSEFLSKMDDFNRKIKEFNKVLLIVSLLNKPFTLTHNLYQDENFEAIETTLIITSKQDVLNALTLFDGGNNLLPNELALIKGLAKKYRPYPISNKKKIKKKEMNDNEEVYYEEYFECVDYSIQEYEDLLKELALEESIFDVDERGNVINWDSGVDKSYFEDTNCFTDEFISNFKEWWSKYQGNNNNTVYCFFTVSSIKRAYNTQKWYRDVKNSLSNKLRKLYDYNFLIKIGKSQGENVYGLVCDVDEMIRLNIPTFARDRTNLGKKEFKRKYPDLYDEFEEFVDKDSKIKCTTIDFDIKNSELYNVPWEDIQ